MMTKIPFERFILTWLLLGKDIEYIIGKLKGFGYYVEEDEVNNVLQSVLQILPENLKQKIELRQCLDIVNEAEVQWVKHFGLFELYDYILRKNIKDIEEPKHFNWVRNCLWIHNHRDIMVLINILMFNGENFDDISNIISFKYKKKIGIETLNLHKEIFWDCDGISAKEALYHCMPFRKNALILKNIRNEQSSEIVQVKEYEDDGSDVSFVFHDTNYIKWKIGYKDITVPTAKTFLEDVKKDSYYKYYEAMNMTQSAEVEEEAGSDSEGSFDSRKIKYRNVEEQKAKAAKHWMEVFIKADKSMPEKIGEGDFFSKMDQLSLDFEDEKLINVNDNKNMLDDVRGDMNA